MIATILAAAEKLPIIGPIISNIKIALICLALVAITNGITALVFYSKGYNSAASQCKMNTVIRERDEARRDLKVQADTAEYYKSQVDLLTAKELERKMKEGEYAAGLKPIVGCVAPATGTGSLRR